MEERWTRGLGGCEKIKLRDALGTMSIETAVELNWPWMTKEYFKSDVGMMEEWATKYPCISFYRVTSKEGKPDTPSRMWIPSVEEMAEKLCGVLTIKKGAVSYRAGKKKYEAKGELREATARICIQVRNDGLIDWSSSGEWERLSALLKQRDEELRAASWE